MIIISDRKTSPQHKVWFPVDQTEYGENPNNGTEWFDSKRILAVL